MPRSLKSAGRRATVLVAVFAVAVSAAAIALAAQGRHSSSRHPSNRHSNTLVFRTTARRTTNAHLASFSVFRRSTAASDTLSPRLQRIANSLFAKDGGDVAQARRAGSSASGNAVYVLPSQDGVCLIDSNLSEAFCQSATQLTSGISLGQVTLCSPFLPSQDIELAGFAADDVSNATVQLSDGTLVPLSIQGNAFVADFARTAALPVAVQWKDQGGLERISAEVPTSLATQPCVTPSQLPPPSALPTPPQPGAYKVTNNGAASTHGSP
jgi:hypothetical protein